jgi:hypothetical protein
MSEVAEGTAEWLASFSGREGGNSSGAGSWVKDTGVAVGINASRGDGVTFVYNKDGGLYVAPPH